MSSISKDRFLYICEISLAKIKKPGFGRWAIKQKMMAPSRMEAEFFGDVSSCETVDELNDMISFWQEDIDAYSDS